MGGKQAYGGVLEEWGRELGNDRCEGVGGERGGGENGWGGVGEGRGGEEEYGCELEGREDLWGRDRKESE